jgi:hypothetical protein
VLNAIVPAIFAAIFGLVGVLICGVITFASSYFLESQKATREREREERTRAASLRLAARIVDAEIADAFSSAQFTLENKRWPESMRTELTDWLAHRVTLGAELSATEWVLRAAITIETLADLRTHPKDQDGTLFPSTISVLQSLIPAFEQGREALRPYCRADPKR